MQDWRFLWSQTPVWLRILSGIIFVAGFSLILYIEHVYGIKGFDIYLMILYGIIIPWLFVCGLFNFSAGITSMRQQHVKWYKQRYFLQGMGYFCWSVGILIFQGINNNLLPELPGLLLDTSLAIAWIAFFIWSFVIDHRDRRNSEPEWLRDS